MTIWQKKWVQTKNDPFGMARIRLTGWYLLILGILITVFTYLTFQAKESAYVRVYTVVSNYQKDQNKLVELEDNYAQFNRRFKQQILWLDLGLIIGGGAAAWWLAGRTLAPVKLMMEEQAAFAGDVSHGLRTPLTSMGLQIEAYKRRAKKLIPATAALLLDLEQEIQHMTRIVQGVLTLTRAGSVASSTQKTSLKQLLTDSQTELAPLAKAKKQQLRVELPETEIMIQGDANQWYQILTIIMENAIKYVPEKGKIETKTQSLPGWVRIIIKDNGPGIPKSDQKKIFEAYYRGKQKNKVPGAGLGLAIAAKMVKQNLGDIKVTDNLPTGAKFILKAKKANLT